MLKIATIGFFDGVHLGHRFLFEQLGKIAAERDLQPLIVTFIDHPRMTLQRSFVPQLLTTAEERRELLSAFGEVLMLPFDTIHTLTAAQFMQQLHEQYNVSVLLMGYDHRFGSDRLVAPEDYQRAGEACGIEVLTIEEFRPGLQHISSTEIRNALTSGQIEKANELLGRPYSLRGEVVHGKGLGRQLGFPTANLQVEAHKLIPGCGVYEAVWMPENRPAFVNIDQQGIIEAHFPAFCGDIYGQTIELHFVRFIRPEKHFESLEALRAQIKADVDSIRHPA